MDKMLTEYQQVVRSDGPARVVEIVTNDPGVAAFVEARMRVLHITGYVRIEPLQP